MIHTPEEILQALDAQLQELYAIGNGPPGPQAVQAAENLMESLTTFKELGKQIIDQADQRLLVVAQCRARAFALAELHQPKSNLN